MSFEILQGDALTRLREMPDESVRCCVTSPPYYGLRNYGTGEWHGGDVSHDHKGDQRFYTEQTAAVSAAGAFSNAGEANIERLKAARWREGGRCECGAEYVDYQIGLEQDPRDYIKSLVAVFDEVRRVLTSDGTCWVNLGDSYNSIGHRKSHSGFNTSTLAGGAQKHFPEQRENTFPGLKHKDLIGIPWRVAFALQESGWWLRQDIIWSKPNPMPEPAKDRCVKGHEYLFLLTKSSHYNFNYEAIQEPVATSHIGRIRADIVGGNKAVAVKHSPGHAYVTNGKGRDRSITSNRNGITGSLDAFESDVRNKRSVWHVTVEPVSDAHFATMPQKLIEPCILAGSAEGDTVLDPFSGSGTTGLVSLKHRRNFIGIELNPEYIKIAEKRLKEVQVKLFS